MNSLNTEKKSIDISVGGARFPFKFVSDNQRRAFVHELITRLDDAGVKPGDYGRIDLQTGETIQSFTAKVQKAYAGAINSVFPMKYSLVN